MRRSFLASLAMSTILCIASIAPVSAHYVKRGATNYIWDGDYKLELRSEISHGSHNGGYYKTDIKVKKSTWTPSGYVWENASGNAFGLEVKQQHIKLNSRTSNNYKVCTETGWITGQDRIVVNHNKRKPVCGYGYYETRTYFCYQRSRHSSQRVCGEHFSGRHRL